MPHALTTPVSVRSLLRGNGPRFARDAAGPVVAFYVAWKLVGLYAGIAAGTATAIVLFVRERRQGRSGLGAGLGLAIALVQAIVGLASGSAIGYLAPPVIANGLYGLAFVISVLIRRPLAGIFAVEMFPFPPEARTSPTFRRTFSIVSLAWGATFLARCAFRLVVLSWGDVDLFIVVNLLTGFPPNVALMVWSIWFAIRSFRRSPDWRPAAYQSPDVDHRKSGPVA